MGCLGHRKKQTQELSDQKWDYIQLNDFKSKGCGAGFAYFYLWCTLITSVAVYAVDSFTAVNLLVFDRWSSSIDPGISFDVSKWIFSVCIILSFINLGYEFFRAYRVMKRGNVAECYLDSLAVRLESIRMGSGQGFRRFLVFAELTKSKKGAEYIAIFTYFSFQSWIRVLICSGPRQVVNVFTLKAVYEAELLVQEESVEGSLAKFFTNIGELYEDDWQAGLILSGMCFTLVVWVFSAIFLLAAILFYVFFLFHWIPRADGGLSGYCERKTNKALLKIVTAKVNKALAKSQTEMYRADTQTTMGFEKPQLGRAATLPTLPNLGSVPTKEDSLPAMPVLGRSETTTTLPVYASRPPSPPEFELSRMDKLRPAPSRSATGASAYSARAPLVGGAADMGYDNSPAPTIPQLDIGMLPPPGRPGTSNSQRTFGARPGLGHMSSNSGSSVRTPVSDGPGPMGPNGMSPFGMPARSATMDNQRPNVRDNFQPGPAPSRSYDAYNPGNRSSPAPRQYDAYNGDERYGSPAPMARQPGPPTRSATGPMPYGQPGPGMPNRSATGPMPPRGPGLAPQRNMTAPMPPQGYGSERPLTPQSTRGPASPYGPGPQRGPSRDPYGYDAEQGNGNFRF